MSRYVCWVKGRDKLVWVEDHDELIRVDVRDETAWTACPDESIFEGRYELARVVDCDY